MSTVNRGEKVGSTLSRGPGGPIVKRRPPIDDGTPAMSDDTAPEPRNDRDPFTIAVQLKLAAALRPSGSVPFSLVEKEQVPRL